MTIAVVIAVAHKTVAGSNLETSFPTRYEVERVKSVRRMKFNGTILCHFLCLDLLPLHGILPHAIKIVNNTAKEPTVQPPPGISGSVIEFVAIIAT